MLLCPTGIDDSPRPSSASHCSVRVAARVLHHRAGGTSAAAAALITEASGVTQASYFWFVSSDSPHARPGSVLVWLAFLEARGKK